MIDMTIHELVPGFVIEPIAELWDFDTIWMNAIALRLKEGHKARGRTLEWIHSLGDELFYWGA